ncbi:MAG: HAMP domain-containing histidine kinase [Proteobacteria bacterium]|nr:HAMP domain-containing histidine kinase [Pseudomonadota bacterium]
MTAPTNRKLSYLLATEMLRMTFAVLAMLIVLTTGYYMLDGQDLRRLTLEMQVRDVIDAISRGEDPATGEIYRNYPKSYGFRVFDHRQAWQRKVIAEANVDLLESFGAESPASGASAGKDRDLFSGVTSMATRDADGDGDLDNVWLITGRGEVGDHVYWVQAAMVNDPAWQWMRVLGRELLDHAVVPTAFFVPALMIAVYFGVRRALRPLAKVARQADALGGAVTAGRPFVPLSADGLPLEFTGVVSGLNAMLAKLDRSLTLQKEFTSDVAHQLRTPLAVLSLEIVGLSAGDARDRIKREIEELADLVNQLLQFAQAEAAMARQRYAVDIAEAARKVCEDLAGDALMAGKHIEFDAPDVGVAIFGHPALIDMAVRNIVDNAIKYAPPRSTISVAVDAEHRIIIEDRGVGVPDAEKELIFQRFWRADNWPRPGNGIGLALVRRIALLHGGDVHVEDRPGGGARFVLAISPAKHGSASPPPAENLNRPWQWPGRRVRTGKKEDEIAPRLAGKATGAPRGDIVDLKG